MSRLTVVLVGLCCFAVGVGSAFVIASIDPETVQEIKQDRVAIAAENEDLKRRLAVETGGVFWGGWGPLDQRPKYFGPAVPFPDFLGSLEESGAWDPSWYTAITGATGLHPELELNMTVPGLDGKLLMLVVERRFPQPLID